MNNPLDNFKNPFDINGEYAKRILNSDTILDSSRFLGNDFLKQAENPQDLDAENIKYSENSLKTLISQGYTIIEGNSGKIINLGTEDSEIKIISLTKFFQPIKKKEKTNMNRKEFLDRCHWVYGECGGVPESIYYAFGIENLSKASGYIEGVTRFSTEEELKKFAWKDNANSYSSGTIQTAHASYREFNDALTKNEKGESDLNLVNIGKRLNNSSFFVNTIKSVIWAHYEWRKDVTNGAYQWAASKEAIILDFSTNSNFEAYGFVDISFSKNGGNYTQTFYKFRRRK